MIRPTLRGIGTVAVVLAAVGLAWLFGQRSLNAVAVPAVVALLAGVVQVVVADDPTIERDPLRPGFPGETRTVDLEIEGGSIVVDVVDEVSSGLEADGNETSVSPPTTLTYDLAFLRRGEHTLGPTTVRIRDVFGLFQRTVTVDTTTTVVVYPELYSLGESGQLSKLLARATTSDREEFDALREYAPGDSLRDVDWKATAKRPEELMVTEFTGREAEGAITIAASATETAVDETAAATASIAVALRKAGIDVDVYTTSGNVSTADRQADQASVLTLLARTAPGQVDDGVWTSADVVVAGSHRRIEVAVDGQRSDFRQWRTGAGNPLAGGYRDGDGRVVSAP
jgi:uncharacterized protein (DUF58 family)